MSETEDLKGRIEELEQRLREAEETLEAIKSGDIDALVVGEQVYTLQGEDHVYHSIVETMSEASLLINSAGSILYANQQLGRLLNIPLNQLIGLSFFDFAESERERLEPFLERSHRTSEKGEFS